MLVGRRQRAAQKPAAATTTKKKMRTASATPLTPPVSAAGRWRSSVAVLSGVARRRRGGVTLGLIGTCGRALRTIR